MCVCVVLRLSSAIQVIKKRTLCCEKCLHSLLELLLTRISLMISTAVKSYFFLLHSMPFAHCSAQCLLSHTRMLFLSLHRYQSNNHSHQPHGFFSGNLQTINVIALFHGLLPPPSHCALRNVDCESQNNKEMNKTILSYQLYFVLNACFHTCVHLTILSAFPKKYSL